MNELIEIGITAGEWLEVVQDIVGDFISNVNDIVSMLGSAITSLPGWLTGYLPSFCIPIIATGLPLILFLRVTGRNN